MLAILLSDICGRYTATDLYENLKLVARNLDHNRRLHGRPAAGTKVELEELDWVATSARYAINRHHIASIVAEQYDLVIAIDCIFNEHLVKPFIDTLTSVVAASPSTVVLVVVELRSADVVSAAPCALQQ